MHIKVDEDLPPAVAEKLRALGVECSTVIEQGMGGTKDPDLWRAVQEHGQFLMTADKGFGDLRTYPPGEHGGILLFRPDEDGIRPILELVDQVLENVVDLDQLVGALTVASPRGIRVRREPA